MQSKEHWDTVYASKSSDHVSWFQPHAKLSLRLIKETGVPADASIIDVGGGASTLVDDLLDSSFSNITVLDLSATAMTAAQQRLGSRACAVQWMEANITEVQLPKNAYDVWHDRAVFHFLISEQERHAYVEQVLRSVRPGGHVIVATFAEDGPTRCSGLPVARYSSEELHDEFGASFTLMQHVKEDHHTPSGALQKFVYCYCRKS
ncbi:class I SAM-dependent methyltransferase [Castellaniella ginsengisoli]